MAQTTINVGSNANDGTGDDLRSAFIAVNANFTELYAASTVSHQLTFSGNEISTNSSNANLKLIDLSGISYNPINETFKLSRDVSVNYMMHFIKN